MEGVRDPTGGFNIRKVYITGLKMETEDVGGFQDLRVASDLHPARKEGPQSDNQ